MEDLFSRIIAKENLYAAARRAALGKRFRDNIAAWRYRLESEIHTLHQQLRDGTYRPGSYRIFRIFDPKEREISVAPFRDRVVHHAVHDFIEPVIDRTFIHDSYACRRGKGTHKAVERAQSFLRANRFCFHGDIRKYFPSIDHTVLKELIRLKIADKDLLRLMDGIIDSADMRNESSTMSLRARFAKQSRQNEIDTPFRLAMTKHGLPIGNLTSQFFANLYLNELDRFVKITLRQKYYIRYMDDFLVYGNDLEELKAFRNRIRDFLRDRLCLEMHDDKSQIYKTSRGITFLGFRLFKDKRRLASKTVRRLYVRLPRLPHASLRAWFAHARNAGTVRLRWGMLARFIGTFRATTGGIAP